MKAITRKSDIKKELDASLPYVATDCPDRFVTELKLRLLETKIHFPLLEYCAIEISKAIDPKLHFDLCEKVFTQNTIGGNVLIGIILQKRLDDNPERALQTATKLISKADVWYICDIIGERVYGHYLRYYPANMVPKMKKMFREENRWVIRSLGAGVHNAIKRGLDKEHVMLVFDLLLSLANYKDKEIRQGIGWAAKTTAKFHPDIIEKRKAEIQHEQNVDNWFRRKVKIGLERYHHAQGN